MRTSLLLLLTTCLLQLTVAGQDLHFTQSGIVPVLHDPSQSAAFDGDMRFSSLYRQQWQSVPVPFRSFTAVVESHLPMPVQLPGRLGWALSFQNDQAGDGQLNWTTVGGRAAYRLPLGSFEIAAGAGIDVGQRAFDPLRLQLGDQYDGELFDPANPTAEFFERSSTSYASLHAGLGLFFKPADRRDRLWAGVSVNHLNKPVIGFWSDIATVRPMLIKLQLQASAAISDRQDVVGWLQAQTQGPYREAMAMIGLRHFSAAVADETLYLTLAAGYRLADAALLCLQLGNARWQASLSYDINTSAFRVATQGRGGPELSFQYIINRVHPPDAFKSCPIF